MENDKYEAIGKLVFHTLNPIIRNLLNAIEQLRALNQSQKTNARYHEAAIAIYKTQSQSYQSIQKVIRQWKDERDTLDLYCKALHEMQTFFFLPIVLTMQTKLMCIHDDGDKAANVGLDMALNNAHLNTLEEASRSWHCYIEFVYVKTMEQPHKSDATIVFDPDLSIKLLTAATIAMSDISKTTHAFSQDCLNIGDDCHQAILLAIESLMKSQRSCTNFKEKVMTALLHNRSFAEMLVITCISSLNDKIIQDNESDLMDIKGNVELKFQSIRTLESILLLQDDNDPDKIRIWRIFFPDIFMKLYQTAFVHVRFTTSVSSPKLASESMKALSTLMKIALTVPSSIVGTPKDPLVALLSASSENEIVTEMTSEMKIFFERVHTVIAKPLILLINIASASPSKMVRSVLVHNLCDSILNYTLHCWTLKMDIESNSTKATQPHLVVHAALESIILGLVDENDNLAFECNKILNAFIASLTPVHASSWCRDIFLPRVLSQIETLPSLARSGRNSDLISTVRLITGYFKSFLIIGNINKGEGRSKSSLHSFLVTQLTTKDIRQCFVDCLVMDNFNTVKYGLIRNYESSQSFNLRYLNEASIKEFKFMIHTLSSLIGLKRAMFYVDGCISDLFDGLSSRISHQRLVYDTEHSRWMERYFGNGVLVYFILSTLTSSSNSKRLKYVESLTKAILPIIFSDEIWKLPSTHACAKLIGAATTSCSSHDNILNSSNVVISAPSNPGSSTFTMSQQNIVRTLSTATTDALVANSMLQTCLLDTICSISSILQEQFRKFIPTLLYPLLSKMSDLNSPSVRSASSTTICVIAKSSNYTTSEVMLSSNVEYLMEMMTTELKNPTNNGSDRFSQGYCFYSLHSVIKNIMDYEGKEHVEPQSFETRILLIVSLLSAMGMWFNRNFKKTTEELLESIIVPRSLVQVYLSTFTQLNFLIGSEKLARAHLTEDDFHWENLLDEFQVNQHLKSETHLKAENFSNDSNSPKISSGISKSLITCTDEVLMINAVLLSLPDLKLQCESLDLMKQIYQLLAAIQNMVKGNQNANDDAMSDIGNPLLQHAHRYWLPLKSNLKSTVDSYLHHDTQYKSRSANRHLAALFRNLVSVISTLSDYCAEFLADKIQKDIFSLFYRVLEAFLKNNQDCTLEENDEIMFVSIANYLIRLFSKYETGIAFQASIPSLSALIMPFLGYASIVGDKAFETLKTILQVKFDYSLRTLYHLSCTKFPERPLLPQRPIQKENMARGESSILIDRCSDLIRFIESEPERPLH